MGKKGDKSARDLLLEVIHSDMSVARAFAAVARSKYDQGKVDEGDFARLKALKFYSKARRSVIQIAEEDRKSDMYELENLRASITALSTHPGELRQSPSAVHEEGLREGLQKIFKRWTFWRN